MCGEEGGGKEREKKGREWDEKGQSCDETDRMVGKEEEKQERLQQLNNRSYRTRKP